MGAAVGITVYFQGEIGRIEHEIREETLLQEGEQVFLHSGNYQFVKQVEEDMVDVEGLYHMILSTIGDTPLLIVSTHKEDDAVDVVLQGSTLDMMQWLVGMQKAHMTLRFDIEKIIHAQGVTTLQCKIRENPKN